MLVNDWSGLDESLFKIKKDIDENKKTIIPFTLSLIDDPIIHKKTRNYMPTKENHSLQSKGIK